MNLNNYSTIILDCDGVIFDSNYLKIDAFRGALSLFDQEIVEEFTCYVKANFGTSRFYLIKVFLKDFLKIEFSEDLYQNILNAYSQNCVSLYDQAKLTRGFTEFVTKYSDKKLYVASGSDQSELRRVFEKRGIDQYFSKIFGSPTAKTDLISLIVRDNKKCVMIGDANSDYKAATDNSVDFIFLSDYTADESIKKSNKYKQVKNLECLT
jgi:HAD superfamily hydrolase (TIGR01549 family)